MKIVGLLVNPNGGDPGNETVRLRNTGSSPVDLDGWTLTDEANNRVTLAGTIAANGELVITLAAGQMPLNNGGDEIQLRNDSGQLVQTVSYVGGDVVPGVELVVLP